MPRNDETAARAPQVYTRVCPECGEPFTHSSPRAVYCSLKCKQRVNNRRMYASNTDDYREKARQRKAANAGKTVPPLPASRRAKPAGQYPVMFYTDSKTVTAISALAYQLKMKVDEMLFEAVLELAERHNVTLVGETQPAKKRRK